MSHLRSKSSNKKSDHKHLSTSPTSRHTRKFSCLGSKEHAQQISDVMIGWEQILDREFQSLDIDADGYVSINDLQTVLK